MEENRPKFTAYTDGSCNNLHPRRPGGSAYVILDADGELYKKASKGFVGTTNNRMEMLAIISVVSTLPRHSDVTIFTDSQYCIKALTSERPKKNLDLVSLSQRICDADFSDIRVHFEWCKGHNGVFYNEMCDRMANAEYERLK